MCVHREIGFLEGEDGLKSVDPEFRSLAKLTYHIPGFGSYGVSCAGHCRLDLKDPRYCRREDWFDPSLFGHLGVLALPEMEHIPNVINILWETAQTDSDARIEIDDGKYHREGNPVYAPGVDLKAYAPAQRTSQGLYAIKLDIRIGHNKVLDKLLADPNYVYDGLRLRGNEELFGRSQQRYAEIIGFWRRLEDRLQAFTQEHGFSQPDFEKREFY